MEKFALNVDFQAAQPSRLHPAPSVKANQMTASSNSSAFKPMRSPNHGAALGFKISASSASDSPACLADVK
ncbi:hypothetical protein MHYP_G00357400 [Metynnis hypsauchen]